MASKSGKRSLSEKAAKVSFGSGTLFLILLASLHFIKPEYDPSWHFISEYELGNYGWIMRFAFVSLGISCVSLVFALWPHTKNIRGYIGSLILIISAVGMWLAAIFVTDPLEVSREQASFSGRMHELGAMLDGIILAAPLITWSILRKNPVFNFARKLLIWSGFLPLLGTIVFGVSMAMMFPKDGVFGPNVLIGWPSRFLIVTEVVWLMIISWQTIKLYKKTKEVIGLLIKKY